MRMLIHTYGRYARQVTWANLGPTLQKQTTLVVQEREAHLYGNFPIMVLPPHITKLADTRQWLIDNLDDYSMCILDDDLQFAVRRNDDPTKFRQPSEDDIYDAFSMMSAALPTYPLVGFGAREGGNRITDPAILCTRQMRVHGIDLLYFRKHGIRFDRVAVMEDFDVTLQVLRSGSKNCVLNSWVTNQAGSNTHGGCSHYRTPLVQTESANRLAALHPGLVSVVQKKTKTSWGGGARTDVVIQWKKAYKS